MSLYTQTIQQEANKLTQPWKELLKDELNYLPEILDAIDTIDGPYFPPAKQVFAWAKAVDPIEVRVVVIGQDPYVRKNQANGLAFSVQQHTPLPPSLRNIFQELLHDFPDTVLKHGDLNNWAKQGVLLLNSTLTVSESRPNSHVETKWNKFTDGIVIQLNKHYKDIIFVLWGSFAKQKANLITVPRNIVLKASHPSPFSADSGFFGSQHFFHINRILRRRKRQPIDWNLY